MIPVKNSAEIIKMRAACEVAATVLYKVTQLVEPGVNTYDLDQAGKRFIQELGATSACYNYRNGSKVYPGYICISVNEEVVHGIGSMKRTIKNGDVVSLDVVIRLDGFIGDNAKTIIVGEAPGKNEDLLGEPFVGRGGKLLDKILAKASFELVFPTLPVIANIFALRFFL